MRLWKRGFLLLCMGLVLNSAASAERYWHQALDELYGLTIEEKGWFAKSDMFLEARAGWGKSVEHYRAHWHSVPDNKRRTIVVRWLGSRAESLSDKEVQSYLESFFQLPVRVEHDPDFENPPESQNKISAELLQEQLLKTLPDDAFTVIGLTTADIYSEDNGPNHLLFGQGHYYNRTAVASLDRLRTSNPRLFRHRVFKLLTHELIHTFSVEHCGYFSCLMNPSGSMEGSDARPLFLCPVCLRKLHLVLNFDIPKRYQEMLQSVSGARLDDATWLKRRLRRPS